MTICGSEIDDALNQAVALTTETFAFVQAMPLPPVAVKERGAGSQLAIDFNASFAGTLTVFFPAPLLERICNSVTPDDHGRATAPAVADIGGEIVNIMVGHFLSLITPPDETYSMGLPTVCTNDPVGELFCYDVEGWRLAVNLEWHQA